MASSAANHQVMLTMRTPSTQKGKRTSPEALVKDTAERKDGTQPASSLEAVALTMPFQETRGGKHLMQAMESTAETLGIPVQEVMDMASIVNAERQEAHNGDSRNQSQSEDEELIEGMESAASQCLELTFSRKFERYHVYFTKKKDKGTGENAPKTRDSKTMKLKQCILSQTIEDAKHKDKIRVTVILEKSTHNISKEETKIDLTIKASVHIMSESALQKMAENTEPLVMWWDRPEEPARKKPYHAKKATTPHEKMKK